jgi:hypothetical protein
MFRLGQQQRTADMRQGGDAVTATLIPGISNAAPLPFPIEGIIKSTGEQVTFVQTCDWRDHSPSLVGIDLDGEFLIASFEESRATDPRIVPNQAASQLRSGVALQRDRVRQ